MEAKVLVLAGLAIQLMLGAVLLVLNSTSFEVKYENELNAGCSDSKESCTPHSSLSPAPHSSHKTKLYTDILVIIFTRPSAFEIRTASRETWMRDFQDKSRVLYRFVLGMGSQSEEVKDRVQREADTHKDMVLLHNHTESFGPACTKKLLLSLQWAVDNVECDYFMKADDDCYLRIGALVDFLHTRTGVFPILHATIRSNSQPMKEGRYADHEWSFGLVYPPFPYGSGYTVSFSVIKSIVKSNAILPLRHFPNEDVTIGVWLAPYNMRYYNIKRFYYNEKNNKEMNISLCPREKKNIIVFHYDQSPELMREAHKCLGKCQEVAC